MSPFGLRVLRFRVLAGAVTGHAFTAAGSFAVTLDGLERSEGLLSLIFKTKVLYMY